MKTRNIADYRTGPPHSSLREPNNPHGEHAQMDQIWPQGTCLILTSCPEKEFLNLASHKCSSWPLKDCYPAEEAKSGNLEEFAFEPIMN